MTDLLKGITVFLIGMMGTGKTTVGQALARQLGYRFFDSDVLIERVSGQSINEIFATQGETTFRDLESQILAELCTYTKTVIATGGGIILKQMNWSYLHHGLIIWLDTPVDLLIQRLSSDTTRPLLKEVDLRQKLESLSQERRSLYAEADLHIVISEELNPEQIVAQILEKIPTVLKSKPISY